MQRNAGKNCKFYEQISDKLFIKRLSNKTFKIGIVMIEIEFPELKNGGVKN